MENTIENTTDIYSVLQKIQAELVAPKNNWNSHGKYSYRSAEDVLASLKPILAKLNACIVIDDDIIEIASKTYLKATATLYWGKTSISTHAFAREPETPRGGMDVAQATGASSSYARKYALGGLLALDGNKDLDPDASNKHEEPVSTNLLTPAERGEIKSAPTVDELKKVCAKITKSNKAKKQAALDAYWERASELAAVTEGN